MSKVGEMFIQSRWYPQLTNQTFGHAKCTRAKECHPAENLGLLNYYAKFIGNLSTLIHPLNELLKMYHPWNWTQECAKAFVDAKEALSSSTVLAHLDPKLPINLAGDASSYGIGAIISQVYQDGSEFASHTLTKSEKNYTQLEKEALSLFFGIKKFHQYLYSCTLITDLKPLLALLGPKSGIHPSAAARLQRWAVLLAAYTYLLKFKSTVQHANADSLSRLLLDSTGSELVSEASLYNIAQLKSLPVTSKQVEQGTSKDTTLSLVITPRKNGQPMFQST